MNWDCGPTEKGFFSCMYISIEFQGEQDKIFLADLSRVDLW